MKRSKILPEEFINSSFSLWSEQWMLLTSGDFRKGSYNTMTVGWGSIGTMWNMPFVQVVVRPTRYTYAFMERYDDFTLCAFPERSREKLSYLGRVSGRDTDKILHSGLTPSGSVTVNSPVFEEAELCFECRKIYRTQFKPDDFLDERIEKNYNNDHHIVYFGEVLMITGTGKFTSGLTDDEPAV